MRQQVALIFDLDGTIIDAFGDIAAAINAPLRKRGLLTHTVDDIHRFVGEGVGRLVERATPASHHHEISVIQEEMMVHYREHGADRAFVYDGILPMLKELQREGFELALLTNKPHDVTLRTVEKMGLTPYFSIIEGQVDGGPRKPEPEALRKVLDQISSDQAIMIGDGNPDGEVAVACGVPFVACLYGTRTREQLEIYEPIAFVERPENLHKILLQALERASNPS